MGGAERSAGRPGGDPADMRSQAPEDLPCPQLVELVTEYLEGALGAEERRRFEAHLALCPGCVVYLDQIRETIRTLGRVVPPPVDPEVKRRLLAIYRDLRGDRRG